MAHTLVVTDSSACAPPAPVVALTLAMAAHTGPGVVGLAWLGRADVA